MKLRDGLLRIELETVRVEYSGEVLYLRFYDPLTAEESPVPSPV